MKTNTYIGNITSKGVTVTNGGLTTFQIACYNGKEQAPFFLRIKAFSNTKISAKMDAKNRVAINGNLRVERWTKNIPEEGDKEVEMFTVYADVVKDCPWEDNKGSAGNRPAPGGNESLPF